MAKKQLLSSVGAAALICAAHAAYAGELRLGLGYSDVLDQNNARAAAAQLEYRTGRLFELGPVDFHLLASGAIDADTDILLGAGVSAGVNLTDDLVLEVGFEPAIYEAGDGADLGGSFQVRSQIGLAYRIAPQWRVGVAFDHVSNMGVYEDNPGEETLWATVGREF